jgi:cell division protein FtsN
MSRDFAKRNNKNIALARSQGKVLTFVIGFITGTLTTFMFYTWQQEGSSETLTQAPLKPEPEIRLEKEIMDFTFHDLFPTDEVQTIAGYEQPSPGSAAAEASSFLLQTGSFQSSRDADARRAEILLLGLDAFIQSKEINGTNWHRVMVGPFSSRQSLSRAQDLLARNHFEAMPRRSTP